MDDHRYWMLTWTTYGSWLPGDDRGFVSNVDRGDGKSHRRNQPGTKPEAKIPGLTVHAKSKTTGPPVYLAIEHAAPLLEQFRQTAAHRGWMFRGVAIMRNHVHIVAGVPGDPEPETLLRDFKSYGSRKLNRLFSQPKSATWWTESGSRRKLPDENAVLAALAYVRDQAHPLLVWIDPRFDLSER